MELLKQGQLRMIKYFLIIFLLLGCGADPNQEFADRLNYPPEWVKSIETLHKPEGFQHAGIFDLNDTFIAQFCDPHGNQLWMKYDNETKQWSGTKYVTLGCRGD